MKRLIPLLVLLSVGAFSVFAGPSIGLSSPSYIFEVVPSTTIKTYFLVYNPSNSTVTIHIEAEGLEVSFSQNDFELKGGENQKVYVYITVPQSLPASGLIDIQPIGAGNIMVGASKQIFLSQKDPFVEVSTDVVTVVEGKSFCLRVTPNFRSTISISYDDSYLIFGETQKEAYACETITFRGRALRAGTTRVSVRAVGEGHDVSKELEIEIGGYSGQFYVTYPDKISIRVGEVKKVEFWASKYCSLFVDEYDDSIISVNAPSFLNAGSNFIKIEGLKRGSTTLKMHVTYENITGYITINVKVGGIGGLNLPSVGETRDYLIFGGIISLFALGIVLKKRKQEYYGY